MFESTFSRTTREDIDLSISDEDILAVLHDFASVITTNPDCRGHNRTDLDPTTFSAPSDAIVYECKDALTFIPQKLWNGGVWYKAIYTEVEDGCDITVKAPMGFSSNNKWRMHSGEEGKAMSIESDNWCPRPFAPFVQGFLEKSHRTQQRIFREKLDERVKARKAEGQQSKSEQQQQRQPEDQSEQQPSRGPKSVMEQRSDQQPVQQPTQQGQQQARPDTRHLETQKQV